VITTVTAAGPATDTPQTDRSTLTRASALGQDAFMRLLLTQMQNQDPTAPQADTEFLAQLAQFSALEQLQQMNQKLDDIAEVFATLRANASGALRVDDSSTAPTVEGSR